MKKRVAVLMLFSALVSPKTALAINCNLSDPDGIARSFGYNLAVGAIKGAVLGGIAAAATFALIPSTGLAFTVFAGVTLYTGVWPAMRSNVSNSMDFLDAAVNNF
ncbi:hypothetical protein MWU54_05815 [Marivita sp. S6314]|uniref:hypothetical protein n=1 Tax=Marivita sp. S6314 TaxID=2926406 RepID=UPI001FF3A34C|nr:hypothetical protein [Marivita sp. S6314]MCK0149530.1 hypothetical protein [Marivita sp. S6314]